MLRPEPKVEPPFSQPVRPPFNATVAIAKLMDASPLAVQSFAD